jgi:hypothetical protein
MSNAEKDKQASEVVDDDDEPDEWCAVSSHKAFFSRTPRANQEIQGQADLQYRMCRYTVSARVETQ